MDIAILFVAEVMDKVRPIEQLWLAAILLSLLGFGLARFRWWLALFTVAFSIGLIDEVIDPRIGPAVASEAGSSYAVQAYLAFAMCILAHLAGIYTSILHKRTSFASQASSRTLHNPD